MPTTIKHQIHVTWDRGEVCRWACECGAIGTTEWTQGYRAEEQAEREHPQAFGGPARTPIQVTGQFRGEIYAAASIDGAWTYRLTRAPRNRWSITHVASGRRMYEASLDAARTATGTGTAATILAIGCPLPAGKPLTRGEHTAILGELSAADMTAMVDKTRRQVPDIVTAAITRIGLPQDYPLSAYTAVKLLGAVYGTAPQVWLDALRAVRPDLAPAHRQVAA